MRIFFGNYTLQDIDQWPEATIAEGSQSQAGDAVLVTAIYTATIAEGTQAQSGDAVTVKGIYSVTIAEGSQTQTSDGFGATPDSPAIIITISEGTQAQAGDAVTVTAIYPVAIAEATQSQSMDAVSGNGIHNVTVSEGLQAQASDAISVISFIPVIIAKGTQSQSMDLLFIYEPEDGFGKRVIYKSRDSEQTIGNRPILIQEDNVFSHTNHRYEVRVKER